MIISKAVGLLSIAALLLAGSAVAADHVSGQVQGAGAPIANSTVTLWEASSNAPKKLRTLRVRSSKEFSGLMQLKETQ